MKYTEYAYDLMLLANTPAHTKSLLHCLDQAAGCIGLDVKANKSEYMRFKLEGAIFTLNGKPL